jgi:hypothetical protein
MRARSVLLSTVLCSGVLALSMMASTAVAAETFKPQGNWAVSKVAAKQPGGSPYCALARKFSNGSILTFARNTKNETSMAVDLSPGTFKTGESYTVMFDAGSGETRSYETQPVSERGIVIRMGRDDKFYDALEKSGQLGVNIASQAFTFSLPDMKSGVQDLSSCLGGSSPESAAAPAQKEPAMTASSVPVEVPAAGNTELQQLKEENTRLRNALETERRGFENKFMEEGENTSAVAELNEKLRLLEKENRELRLQSNSGTVSSAKMEPVSCSPDMTAQTAMNTQIDALKEENARLKTEIEAHKQKSAGADTSEKSSVDLAAAQDRAKMAEARVTELQEEIVKLQQTGDQKDAVPGGSRVAALQEEIARLRAQKTVSPEEDPRFIALQSQIAKLEAENQSLKVTKIEPKIVDLTAKDSTADNLATVRQLKETEAQLASAKAERDRLAAEIDAIKNSDADDRVKISSDNWNLEQATQRFNESERETRRLGLALEQERAKCAVEKKDLEYMLFDPKIATQEQIAHLTVLEEELAQAKQKADAGGNKDKTAMLEKRIQELESGSGPAQQQVVTYKARVDDLEQKLAAAKMEIDQMQRSAATEPKVEDKTALVDSLRQEIAGLNAKISSMEASARVSDRASMQPPVSAVSMDRANAVVPRPDMDENLVVASAVNEESVPPSAAPVPPAPEPEKTAVVEPPATAPSPESKLIQPADIETLLHKANLKTTVPVQKLEGVSGNNRVAYRWETGDMFGTAEQKELQAAAQFDQYVRDYMDSVKSRCEGQFTAIPALEEVLGSKRISTHQISCIDATGSGAAAALVFYTDNGKTFTTLAYESAPQSMKAVTDARDKVVSVLRGAKMAAR